MNRIALQIGYRDFKYGDPYFRCPVCGKPALYTGKNGTCTSCALDFITVKVPSKKLTPAAQTYGAIGASLLLVAAVVWVTGRDKRVI